MSEAYATRNFWRLSLVVGLLVLAGTIVLGQDAIEVAGDQYEVVLENDRVRVLRGRYAPGAKSAMHEHPGSVVVTLTNGSLRVTAPDGEMADQFLQRGRVAWSGGAHEIENIGSEELQVVIVEIKNTSFLDRVFGE
jgi:quercetin dioxygenase-like cupin family protein